MNLSKLKVIELASVLAGPDVGMFFAELGAKVIKIENQRTGGDVTRKWKTSKEKTPGNISAYFCAVNWGKEHLFIDLSTSDGQQKVHDLIVEADIVIANFKPGSAEKLNMDYSSCKALNPSLIYGEINGYGSESSRAAYDVVLQAETGFMSINGEKDGGPLKMPIALIDVLAAHHLKEGILLALLNRYESKKGAYVEVSLYDAAISSLKNQATNYLMNDNIPKRMGSLHPNIAPYGETFKTKDGESLVLGIGSDKQFLELLSILGASEIGQMDEFLNNQERVKNRKMLAEMLSSYFAQYSERELMKAIVEKNLPVGSVYNMKDVFEQPRAQQLILTEQINGTTTKRVKSGVFKISYH